MWNNKKQLSKKKVYGKDKHKIVDDFIYFDDNTCIELYKEYGDDITDIRYYKLVNNFSIKFPIYKMKKVLHRKDGPAIEIENGGEKWYKNGKLHRKDGPAVTICYDGELYSKEWYKNDKLHRKDGPARQIWDDKEIYHEEWSINDKLHRKDGPAYRWRNFEEWRIDGKLHREDGPAKGNKYYYLNGVSYRNKRRWTRALKEMKQKQLNDYMSSRMNTK
jgi:hypothetical protein